MTKTNSRPNLVGPKAHAATKRYMKSAVRQEIKRIRQKLADLESEIVEDVYSVIIMELDGAIEAAYYEGLRDGENNDRT